MANLGQEQLSPGMEIPEAHPFQVTRDKDSEIRNLATCWSRSRRGCGSAALPTWWASRSIKRFPPPVFEILLVRAGVRSSFRQRRSGKKFSHFVALRVGS